MKEIFDIALTWGCFIAGFVIVKKLQLKPTQRNALTNSGAAFVLYALLSATTVLVFETVPSLLPQKGDEANYVFPIGFLAIGIVLFLIGSITSPSKKKR